MHLSIRGKLFALLLIVFVPFVILQIISLISQYHEIIDVEFKANQDYAQAISTAFTNYIDGLWNSEFTLGQAMVSNPSIDSDKIEQYMNDALVSQTAVVRYSWVDTNGVVTASTYKGGKGISLADEECIQHIINGEDEYVSPIIQGRLNNDIIMSVTRAVLRGGKLVGIIVAAVDVKKIGLILPDSREGKGRTFIIMDKNSMIVYRSGLEDISLNRRAVDPNFPGIASLNGYTLRVNSWTSQYDGIKRMGISVPIKNIGWECYAASPVDEVIKENIHQMRRSIAVSVVVIAGSAAALYIFGRMFLKPVMVLKNASDEISCGNLEARTNIKGDDEFAEACMAFDRMAEKTQQLEVSRQLFFRESVHELRNPMTSVKGIVSLLRIRAGEGKPLSDSAELMGILESEVDRLSGLLNEITEAFRASKEDIRLKVSYGRIDIKDIITYVLNPFMASETGRKFNLRQEYDGPLWTMGDRERLGDVIRNLIGNALKYSPEGTDVDINISRDENYGVIAIRDRGIGIPENQLNKIFESFYRSDNIKGKDPGGMGLGLYICKDIIMRHGGNIWAENNTDGGSTFYVKLPLYNDGKSDKKQ